MRLNPGPVSKLIDSLALAPGLDPADLMRRFLDWRDTGAYSCTGTCFDIGNATSAALERFRRTGEPLAGSADPAASGNGALMRLAPVVIRHWRDRDALQVVAALQTRTTHGSPATLAASAVFADLLADAIAGASLPEVLASPAAERIEGGWRGLHRDNVEGAGWVVQSLQAAVWAVSHTTDFRSAVLLAANLGNDADTTAAIAGQLAGAIYGAAGIPPGWLEALAWRGRLEGAAQALFDAAWPEADDPEHENPINNEDDTAAEASTLDDAGLDLTRASGGPGWVSNLVRARELPVCDIRSARNGRKPDHFGLDHARRRGWALLQDGLRLWLDPQARLDGVARHGGGPFLDARCGRDSAGH